MKRFARHLTVAVLLAVSLPAVQPQTTHPDAPQKPAPRTGVDRGKLQTPGQVPGEQKKEFIRMLDTLPHEGEFYTVAAIEKAGPYLPVLLALTEKDMEEYDFYPFGALSRGLCDRQEHRAYVVQHFAQIRHPLLKLLWAAMLFDAGESSPEIVRFLKVALRSPQQAKLLSEIVGPEYEEFKKKVLAHFDGHRSRGKGGT
jgi:hypothetical protein